MYKGCCVDNQMHDPSVYSVSALLSITTAGVGEMQIQPAGASYLGEEAYSKMQEYFGILRQT
jgi:hypothetical protein